MSGNSPRKSPGKRSPPQPHRACATVGEGVDFCVEELERSGIVLPHPRAELRQRALQALETLGTS